MPNPFNYGPLVTDPAMFFGREAELDSLCTRLRNMQSTSVVGMRRIGKSSLLYQLARTLPDVLGQNFVPLYIDLHDARYRTVTSFVKSVVIGLNERMGGILTVSTVTDMSSFSEMIDKLSRRDVRLVLCLDRFEEFMQHSEEFDNDFLEALRALGGRARLAMVTTSRAPLADLIQDEGLTSPFHDIFSQIELGLLEPDAAQALRREPLEREGIELSPQDEALVEELGGRHPFFLQMACYYLYEALQESESTRVDVADVVRENFDRDAELHHSRLWHHLSPGKKAALKAVVGQAICTDETERVLELLERLGVVERVDAGWQTFSTAFARCVQQYSREVLQELEPGPEPDTEPGPEAGEGHSPSIAFRLLLFAGTATIVVVIAALIASQVPEQQILPMLIITAVILLFALVGVGRLTGHDFLQFVSDALFRLFGVRDS